MTFSKKTKEQPTVTVILSAGPDSLDVISCLESLIQQKYNNLEFLIVDNGLKRKTLNQISRILAKTEFMSFIKNLEDLRRTSYWTRGEEIRGTLIFIASPYVIYDRDCIMNLVSRLQEDPRIRAVNPERISGFKSKSFTQKCLFTIESSIKHQGDIFGGISTNGLLFRRKPQEGTFYWDLIQKGYSEADVERIQYMLGYIATVKDAQCYPNHPQSFIKFFRSVYIEARYNRPYLPFRTHTFFSASLMALVVIFGVIMEIFSSLYKLFNGQYIVTFLIPLYVVILIPRLFSWKDIEKKWTLLIIPVFRILSAFSYVLGKLLRHFKLYKIRDLVSNTPGITILPTSLGFIFFRNLGYTSITRNIIYLFYLGFALSLVLFKDLKLINHIFYGLMMSTPIILFLTWIRDDIRIRGIIDNVLPSIIYLTDPLILCLIIGCLVYILNLGKHIRAYIRSREE